VAGNADVLLRERSLRIIFLGLASLLAAAAAFWGTHVFLDSGASLRPAALTAGGAVSLKLAQFTAASGGRIQVSADGAVLSSTFKPDGTGAILGAAYVNFTGANIVARPGRQLRIEIDASLNVVADGGGQVMDVHYVQNGLQSSPSLRFPLSPGRKTYSIVYAVPQERRGAERVDTLWLRSDVEGAGRSVTLHAISLRVE
jgi:hypothetical protein